MILYINKKLLFQNFYNFFIKNIIILLIFVNQTLLHHFSYLNHLIQHSPLYYRFSTLNLILKTFYSSIDRLILVFISIFLGILLQQLRVFSSKVIFFGFQKPLWLPVLRKNFNTLTMLLQLSIVMLIHLSRYPIEMRFRSILSFYLVFKKCFRANYFFLNVLHLISYSMFSMSFLFLQKFSKFFKVSSFFFSNIDCLSFSDSLFSLSLALSLASSYF